MISPWELSGLSSEPTICHKPDFTDSTAAMTARTNSSHDGDVSRKRDWWLAAQLPHIASDIGASLWSPSVHAAPMRNTGDAPLRSSPAATALLQCRTAARGLGRALTLRYQLCGVSRAHPHPPDPTGAATRQQAEGPPAPHRSSIHRSSR